MPTMAAQCTRKHVEMPSEGGVGNFFFFPEGHTDLDEAKGHKSGCVFLIPNWDILT